MIKPIIYHGEPGSVLTHGVGVLLSFIALIALIVIAWTQGTFWHLVTFPVFGLSLLLLYSASTLYHAVPRYHAAKKIMQKLDRSMIFILIAGTYTPICLTVLRNSLGWNLLGAVWILALLGIALKISFKTLPSWFTTIFYMIMGWLGIFALMPLWEVLPSSSIAWLIAGGVLYSIGVIFFTLEYFIKPHRWFGMHEIFHVFVMAGSFSHVWFTSVHLIGT